MIMHTNKKKFEVEDRRKQVARLLAKSLTEQEIADRLGVDRTTISRDVQALKRISQQFVYDVAKSDFAFYYKKCLDSIDLVHKQQWQIIDKEESLTRDDQMRFDFLERIKGTIILLGNYYDIAPTKHRSPMEEVFFHDRDRPKILRGSYLTKGSGELDPDQPILDSEETTTEMDYSNRKF